MENDQAELDRRHTRFLRQMLVLGPLVVLWLYGISDSFILSQASDNVSRFISETRQGHDHGTPVCRPSADQDDVYLRASRWKWEPELVLTRGRSYTLHLSSCDVSHGFALDAFSVQALVEPGQECVLHLTPQQTGQFEIRCDEYCGPGHEVMSGKLYVSE